MPLKAAQLFDRVVLRALQGHNTQTYGIYLLDIGKYHSNQQVRYTN